MAWQPLTQFVAIDRLADLMIARFGAISGMKNVNVLTAHYDPDIMPGLETLTLWGTEMDQDFGAVGNMRMDELYRMQGKLLVAMTFRPDRELAARNCRARCAAIIGELQDELRSNPTLTDLVVWARLARMTQAYLSTDKYVLGELTLEIDVKANLSIT